MPKFKLSRLYDKNRPQSPEAERGAGYWTPMSEANLELVRRAYEAWNGGDFEAAVGFLHPDVEITVPPNLPEAGTYRGREQVSHWVADELLPILEEVRAEPEQFLPAGDRVVVFVRYYARGRSSGIDVRGMSVDSHVWTLEEGKVRSLEMYSGTEPALETAGLA
jgi:ketosteroid isomerase-like protein